MRAQVRLGEADGTWTSEESEVSNVQQYSLVEVPGRVENPTNLIAALCGYEALSECFLNPTAKPLVLRLCPADPYSKFIPATTYRSMALVLKLRKKKDGSAAELLLEGIVRQTYKFTALADYYQAPEDHFRFPYDDVNELEKLRHMLLNARQQSSDGVDDDAQRLREASISASFGTGDVLPPVFTRQTHPFDYKYEGNPFTTTARYFLAPKRTPSDDCTPFDDVGEYLDEESNRLSIVRRGDGVVCNATARVNDSALPTPADIPKNLPITGRLEPELLDEVRGMFERRPLWQRVSLLANLSKNVTLWRIKAVLAHTCFLFLDGPFRGCLCRLGYDPRSDPESRIYQSIDFRDVHFRSYRYKTQKGDRNASAAIWKDAQITVDYKFLRAAAKPACLYQFCDVEDSTIQHVVQTAIPLSEFSAVSGWYTADTLARIRDLMALRSQALRKAEAEAAAHKAGGE